MKKADILKIPAKNTQRKTNLPSQASWLNFNNNMKNFSKAVKLVGIRRIELLYKTYTVPSAQENF